MTSASASNALPAGVDAEAEYASIERALLESALGRWFLAEHSRRARRIESERLDEALGKLQSSLRQPPALLGQLKTEISALQAVMADARHTALAKPAQPADERGPAAILKAAEDLHQLTWSLQAAPVDAAACEQIARHAAAIQAQSAAQAAISKRAVAVAERLDAALAKIDGILHTISLEASSEPAPKG